MGSYGTGSISTLIFIFAAFVRLFVQVLYDGMVALFKMAVALATKEGRNANGQFANRWKRRICLAAKRAMIYQAQYALRKHLRDEMPGYDDLSDDDRDIQMNDFDSEYV